MMEYLSKELPAPFLQPELVDKVAAMLAYFLDMLVGKSVKELKACGLGGGGGCGVCDGWSFVVWWV